MKKRSVARTLALGTLVLLVGAGLPTVPAAAGLCDPQPVGVPNPNGPIQNLADDVDSLIHGGGSTAEIAARAVNEIQGCADSLSLNSDLVQIAPVNDVTQHGAPFTVAFHVANIAPLPLPVEVVVESVSLGLDDQCILTETTIAGAPPEGGTEKPTYRLYPPSWKDLADSLGLPLAPPTSIVIQANGHAATASGGDAYENQECDITLALAATQGATNELLTSVAKVVALPLPILEIPLGHIEIIGGDATGSVLNTPNINGDLPIQGLSENLTVNAFVTTHYYDTSDEWTDTDHGNVIFQVGTGGEDGNYVNKVEKSVYGTRLIVPSGESKSVCVYGEFWDEDLLTGDDKLVTGESMCLSITYTQATDVFVPGPLTTECDQVVETHLSGTVPSAQDYVACSLSLVGSPTPVPTGNHGYLPFPIETATGSGLVILPPPPEA